MTPSPTVSVVIPAHNEETVIGRRIENLLALDYPPDLFTIVVASDASDDGTHAIVDDDWYYEMSALRAFEKHGPGLTLPQLLAAEAAAAEAKLRAAAEAAVQG